MVITLFCLVHGENRRNIFSVKIGNESVSELKAAIKAKMQDEFANIDASKLTLWRVSIPVDNNTDAILANLVLEINDEYGIRELEFPTEDIFDAFQVPGNFLPKHIHV